jgi:hypothetical protein
MKKIFFYFMVLVAAAACGMVEEENNLSLTGNSRMITEVISGSHGFSTKASIADNGSFAWTVGDNIAIHVSKGETHKYVFTSGEGGASVAAATADFSVSYEEGYTRDAFAVYPSTIVSATASNYGQSGAPLDVTLPGSYTLAQVTGATTPCPMIAANAAGTNWTFYQLCGMLRLTVNDIPADAKRLEIDFNGKKVCGDFSVASAVTPGTSVISTADDATSDCITITKDGTNATLGATSLVLNIPLPAGQYGKITVTAYDALTGGTALLIANVSFSYLADNAHATKKEATLGPIQGTFNFTFKDGSVLSNVRFARVFSCQNKLHNGPFTESDDDDLPSTITANLLFDANSGDQLACQVVTGDGKVYAGIVDVPAGGYQIGQTYDVTFDVEPYTFTVASGKKVYFSPGDLRVDNGVYSFSQPFDTEGWKSTSTSLSKRVWFNYGEIASGQTIFGINWRTPNSLTTSTEIPTPQEWDGIIGRTNMNNGVNAFYRVSVSGYANCLLLPPDETVEADLDGLTEGATITDYAKYLGKGFVLLMNTGRATYTTKLNWAEEDQGWYWTLWNNMSRNRTYFYWTTSSNPRVDWATNQFRMRVRLIKDE